MFSEVLTEVVAPLQTSLPEDPSQSALIRSTSNFRHGPRS